MIDNSTTLEVRPWPPPDRTMVEIVLRTPCVWFEEINRRGISARRAISGLVADILQGDFRQTWIELMQYRFKVPRAGDSVRASIPMLGKEWECLQSAARAVGTSEAELALLILARELEVDCHKQPSAPAPDFRSRGRRRKPACNVIRGPWIAAKA
jgi:hypothetical protein